MSARVLVVDDMLPNVKLLEAKLMSEYFQVITASNGVEALEKVEAESPDIVLLDIMMPEMDGYEVCEKIRANPKTAHIPVVMVTALSDQADRNKGLQAGADDFLTKPVNDLALFARVRSLTRLKMMMDEWRAREATVEQFADDEHANFFSETTEKARILAVTESKLELDQLTMAVATDQSDVQGEVSGDVAYKRAQVQDFDLIIISLSMQNQDGLRLCSMLRNNDRTRSIPMLIIGEEYEMERVAKSLEIGAHDYVLKPLDNGEILARIRTQIRKKRYQNRLRMHFEESLSMALTDGLTGTFNRRYLDRHLPKLIKRSRTASKPVTLMMFDIDHFKKVNDQYGHIVGDEILKEVAKRIHWRLRSSDLLVRYGGEEFVVVLPYVGLESAEIIAERLRMAISDEVFKVPSYEEPIHVTISIGARIDAYSELSEKDLLKHADEALYKAKNSGRNKSVIYKDDLEITKTGT